MSALPLTILVDADVVAFQQQQRPKHASLKLIITRLTFCMDSSN